MDHSAATPTPFPSSLYSTAAQWPKQEPAADHCNTPTWSSKLITILCRIGVFNAPEGCQPIALLERHWALPRGQCGSPLPVLHRMCHGAHTTPVSWAELSWFDLEPLGEHTWKCAALPAHVGKAVPTGKGRSFSTGALEAVTDIVCHTWGTANVGGKKKECDRAQDGHSCRELPASPTGLDHYSQYIFLQLKVYIQIPWQITCAIPDVHLPVTQIYWYVQSYLSSDCSAAHHNPGSRITSPLWLACTSLGKPAGCWP